jgi:hypothetical protein
MSLPKKSFIIVLTVALIASATPTLAANQTFTPNSKISSGNSYQGVSISGVGGAIASCTNIGSFLVNTASGFFSNTKYAQSAAKAAYSFSGLDQSVSTSDQKTQDKLDAQTKTTNCLNGIAYAVAKNTLAQVTNKTLNWVNTGLNGNPLYVQNTDSYLRSIANKQISAFLQTAQGSDPIFGNALESSIRQGVTGTSDGLINVSMNTPQAKAYNSFLGDFTSGGWASLLNPAYNPIGALFTATDSVSKKVASSTTNATNEIQRNNGFLDLKHCVQYSATVNTANTKTAVNSGLSNNPTCVQWATDTPGSIIANQVQTITTSPIRQLEYADKINEVLGSFFDSFVNNLLQKGLRGGGNGQSLDFGLSSSAGDNVVTDANGNTLSSSDTSSLGYQASTGNNGITQNFDISRPQQFRAILQTQMDFLNATLDAQASLNKIMPNLGALDYCVPGPNPNWQSGASANLDSLLGGLVQADPRTLSSFHNFMAHEPLLGSQLDAIISIFDGGTKPPNIFSTPGYMTDPASGNTIQIPRVFNDQSVAITIGQISAGYNTAYKAVAGQYSYWSTVIQSTDNLGQTLNANPVERAFIAAAAGDSDSSYTGGILPDMETNINSILAYNKAASTINDQYDTNIGQTQNNIIQMQKIQQQIIDIVSTAKTQYISDRAKAGNPVVQACIDNAYQIDTSTIVPQARVEGPVSPNYNVDTAMQAHSQKSANFFYKNIAI